MSDYTDKLSERMSELLDAHGTTGAIAAIVVELGALRESITKVAQTEQGSRNHAITTRSALADRLDVLERLRRQGDEVWRTSDRDDRKARENLSRRISTLEAGDVAATARRLERLESDIDSKTERLSRGLGLLGERLAKFETSPGAGVRRGVGEQLRTLKVDSERHRAQLEQIEQDNGEDRRISVQSGAAMHLRVDLLERSKPRAHRELNARVDALTHEAKRGAAARGRASKRLASLEATRAGGTYLDPLRELDSKPPQRRPVVHCYTTSQGDAWLYPDNNAPRPSTPYTATVVQAGPVSLEVRVYDEPLTGDVDENKI